MLEALSREFRQGVPWELLYADDLGLIAETEKELLEKVELWRFGMESKGLRVNMAKTKIMKCQPKAGLREETGKLRTDHKCPGKLKDNANFRCSVCVSRNAAEMRKCKNEVELLNGEKIEVVDVTCASRVN